MANCNTYSRGLRSRSRSDSTSSEEEEIYDDMNIGDRENGDTTPPKLVQRTLLLCSDGVRDEDDDEDSDFEELDDFSEPLYRGTFYSCRQIDLDNARRLQIFQEERGKKHKNEMQRLELKLKADGAAAYFNMPTNAAVVIEKVAQLKAVKTLHNFLRRSWRYVLRNSFMTVNVLWLLAPLCCFVIAIAAPHYLNSVILYADNITSKVVGIGGADAGFDAGAVRSVVKEILDMKLVTLNEELGVLRQTVQSQELEIEAMKLLHDTVRRSHDEELRKLSSTELDSVIYVHVKTVVAKHTKELWDKSMNSTSRLQQDVRAAAKERSLISTTLKHQAEHLDSLRSNVDRLAISERGSDSLVRKDLVEWRESFENKVQAEIQLGLQEIEGRLLSVLQEEESSLALSGLDATDPGILQAIEVAVQAIEIKKTGRVDHAALANGASVIRSERELLDQDVSSLVQLLFQLLGLSDNDGTFTSSSFRRAPILFLGQLFSSGDNPWWLSRHNGRPETALSETMEMGSCWAISGSSGRLSVKFAQQIVADAITIDHIPAQTASDISSAPNEFRILGISGHPLRETVEVTPFGNFSYANTGPASQTFKLKLPLNKRSIVDGIMLELLSNHGNHEYTCIYRFRVHGQLA